MRSITSFVQWRSRSCWLHRHFADRFFVGVPDHGNVKNPMRMAGFLLLLAGWIIALTAIVLLPSPVARGAFLLAGMAVEILGLVLVFRSHRPAHATEDRR